MLQKYQAAILIVDDKEANLLALENLLLDDNRTILRALSGKEALRIALNNPVDLIILDVKMPDMDGFEVARTLHLNRKTKDIPIIFASAERTEHAFMMKGLEEGAIDYFSKPMEPEIVKAKVDVHLKVQLQKRELIDKNSELQKSALLISNSADIIGVIDAGSLNLEEVNPAFTTILGYTEEEAKKEPITDFLDSEGKCRFDELAKQPGEQFSVDTRIYCKDGTIKWLQWKVVVADKKWYVNARDITEVRQLHLELQSKVEELIEVNHELESFSYSVSHDLRSPLRAVDGYSQMMEEDYVGVMDEEAKDLLAKIRRNAQYMGVLIDELLGFSRLGRKEIKKQMVDTRQMVEQALHELSQARPFRAEVEIDDLPVSYGDRLLLYQIWTNLISNASKYSEKKKSPVIEIGAMDDENETTYFIRDNGAGFDMRYADKLFGVFQRLHSGEEFEGTGIGLAIVHRIITKHGGKIRAEAKVNHGATFYFSLPKQQIADKSV